MTVLTLDMETRDPNIKLKKGAGWVYKDFEILGAAYKKGEAPSLFTSDMEIVKREVSEARTIICHNAQYDIGCLHRLGIDYKDKIIVDTVILAKLYDNTMSSYSLDHLSSYLLGSRKDYAALEEAAQSLGIKKYMDRMKDLFLARPELVAQYAKQDVELTYRLSQYFKKELYKEAIELVPFYSDLIKALVLWRSRGVRVDINQAKKSADILDALHKESLDKFYEYCPGVNIESTKQLAEAFINLGLTPGKSEKGGHSVDSKWRSTQNHPAIDALEDAKKYQKLRREFVDGIIERSEEGRIYPELNIMGAAETGRFSSSNPNIQQIPKRDGLATELVRSIIVADDGENIYSLDFSSQEPRLQIHYAFLSGCKGADVIRESYLKNPAHDLHQQVADIAGIDRKQAKTINLGISYGMGIEKLSASLKIDEKSAKELISKYKKLTPYLHQLNKAVRESGEGKGFIRTLLGRRLKMDYEKPYKALNKLIQGSAADMTSAALVLAYREGLPILFSVHDELIMSSSDHRDAIKLKKIMESAVNLQVPNLTEIMYGASWGKLSPLNISNVDTCCDEEKHI